MYYATPDLSGTGQLNTVNGATSSAGFFFAAVHSEQSVSSAVVAGIDVDNKRVAWQLSFANAYWLRVHVAVPAIPGTDGLKSAPFVVVAKCARQESGDEPCTAEIRAPNDGRLLQTIKLGDGYNSGILSGFFSVQLLGADMHKIVITWTGSQNSNMPGTVVVPLKI